MDASIAAYLDEPAQGIAVDGELDPALPTASAMPIHRETVDSESLRMSRLIDWAKANGAQFASITIDGADGHRSIRAIAELPEGAEVARIPQHLFITSDTAKQSRIGRLLAALPHAISERSFLAAFLLQTRREGGFWAPFVDAMPRRIDGHAIGFGVLELMALDPRSLVGCVVKMVRNLFKSDFDSVAETLASEGFGRDDFEWAYCCVRTRAYELRIGDMKSATLIPLADMLNHENSPPTVGARPDMTDYVITATRSIEAGAEVKATYGDRSNASLFGTYGFCLDGNEFDAAGVAIMDRVYIVMRKYADPEMRAMFKALRLSTPILLRQAMSASGDTPCGIDHEFACLNTLHDACEAIVVRSMNCLSNDSLVRGAGPDQAVAAALIAATKSETDVLWYLVSLTETAGRVLRDLGTDAQDRELLTYMDSDYAAQILALVDTAGAAA